MANKKTIHFLQLSIIFLSITIFGLASSWGHVREMRQHAGMMGMTMGDIMAVMHGKDATFADMLWQRENTVFSQVAMTAHHERGRDFIAISHYWSTAIIVILLPFILAGSVFLSVIWLK